MTPVRTAVVHNGSVPLAVTDSGGEGPVIVLMPGLGMLQTSLSKVASRLPGWRVITMDLRGHGASGTAAWSFADAVEDLSAVVRHFGLASPYVGGHSLGGMIALRYAMGGRPTAGVVNVDGWGPGIASRFPGEDLALVEASLATIAEGHLPSRLARVLSSLGRQSREGTNRQVLAELAGADVVGWHAAAPCPSLAFNAVAPASGAARWLLGAEMIRLQRAHREGLRRDLAALAASRPDVMVVEVDAQHMLIGTHPAVVAEAILAFHERCRG